MAASDDRPASPPQSGANHLDKEYPSITIEGPEGKTIEALLLFEVDDELRHAQVISTLAYMKAFIVYTKRMPTHVCSFGEISRMVSEAGILEGIDKDSIDILAEHVNHATGTIGPFQIAKGIPSRNGEDGKLDFLVQPTSRKAEYETDESGNIDYKKCNLFENVLIGEQIATLRPPTLGKPGYDIFGKNLPAEDGKPISVRLGKNVSTRDNNTTFYAEADGRVEWDRSKLSVETVYEVLGKVDYRTGNIDFVGDVIIRGAVLDDFDITGKKSITIFGNVGKCNLKSDGNIRITGGITGRKEASIVVGGKLETKYLNDIDVYADGDIIVEKEILNCDVRTMGAINIERGSIVGGSALAFSGVTAHNVGSDLGVNTRICSGLDWRTEEKIEELTEKIEKLQEQVDAIEASVEPVLDNRAFIGGMSDEQKETLLAITEQLRDIRNKYAELEEKRDSLENNTQVDRVNQINVNYLAYPGVIVRFSHVQGQLKKQHRGPMSIIQDSLIDDIRVVQQFPLVAENSQYKPDASKIKELK